MQGRASQWHCGRFVLSLDTPLVMGILNVTPDSFSDGGSHEDPASAVQWGERLIAEGADIVDVGGESTRPGAAPVSVAEEIARVRPVIMRLSEESAPISADTRRVEVATAAVESGASIINDVSGFRDPAMVELAAQTDVGVVVMHMLGDPSTMQQEPQYHDVVAEVGGYLLAQAATLEAAGVDRRRIALDPGLGFGKTLEHNIKLLQATDELASYGYPLLIGASRKSFVGSITGVSVAHERLGGSLSAALYAARRGAGILRVHDVAQTLEALSMQRVLETRT